MDFTVNKVALIGLVVIIIVCVSSCASKKLYGTFTNIPIEGNYRESLDWAVSNGVVGMSLYAGKGDKAFLGSEGLADIQSNTLMTANHKHRIGSITKSFVAVLTVKLHEQGLLNLDDKVKDWLPHSILKTTQCADTVSIRQLLQHTSGIDNYSDNIAFKDSFNKAAEFPWHYQHFLYFTQNTEREGSSTKQFFYSNTGYLLLGLIIERATQLDLAQAMSRYVTEPLQLSNTGFLSETSEISNLVTGYDKRTFETDYVSVSSFPLHLSDAGMYSTVQDLARFVKGLFSKQLLFKPTVIEQVTGSIETDISGTEYGLGFYLQRDRNDQIIKVWHSGHITGTRAMMMYLPQSDETLAYMINSSDRRSADVWNLYKLMAESFKFPK